MSLLPPLVIKNGQVQQIAAGDQLQVAGGIASTNLASGSVVFAGAGGLLTQDLDLRWDATLGELIVSSFTTSREQFMGVMRPGLHAFYNGTTSGGSYYAIGQAFSIDGVDWVRDANNPILIPTTGWESRIVKDPWAVIVEDVLYLYYSGQDGSTFRIGLATSRDFGKTFERHAGNPVLDIGAGGQFDDAGVLTPVVLYDADEPNADKRWKLWYTSRKAADGKQRIGYAYSADGLSWTKFGLVLGLGASSQFDDNLLEVRGINKVGGTYYLWYAGNTVDTRTRWSLGLVTFTDAEGPYTRHPNNPLIRNNAAKAKPLTANTLAGSATVTVADTSVFERNEFVILASSTATPQLVRINRIDSGTQLTLQDAAVRDFKIADGAAIRSVDNWSLQPRTIYREGNHWTMALTLFQVFSDMGYLFELSGLATAPDLAGPWTFARSRGIALVPDPQNSPWDLISAENLCVIPLRFSKAARLASVLKDSPQALDLNRRLSVTAKPTFTITGRVSANSGTNQVSGFGTRFASEVVAHDLITIGTETVAVSAISSDTALTVESPFSSTHTKVPATVTPAALVVKDAAGNARLLVGPDGQVQAAAGYFFLGDTDTGVITPTADTISLQTGGLEALRVDSSRRVGIRVSPSDSVLTVSAGDGVFAQTNRNALIRSTINGNGILFGHNNPEYLCVLGSFTGNAHPVICFYCYHSNTNNALKRASSSNKPSYLEVNTAGDLIYRTAPSGAADADITDFTARLMITNAGQLSLDPGSASSPRYSFTNDLSSGFFSPGTGIVSVAASGDERFRVTSNGVAVGPASFSPNTTNTLVIVNGSPPTMAIPTAVQLYSKSGELCAYNAAGDEVCLTGHVAMHVLPNAGSASFSSIGLPAPTTYGTLTNSDDTDGPWVDATTDASTESVAGLQTPAVARLDWEPTYNALIKLGAAISSVRYWAGLFSGDPTASATPAVHLAAFRYSTQVEPTVKWRCVTDNGSGTPTVTETGVVVSPGTKYRLRIACTASDVAFFIDGALVATHATKLPAANILLSVWNTVIAVESSSRSLTLGRLSVQHK